MLFFDNQFGDTEAYVKAFRDVIRGEGIAEEHKAILLAHYQSPAHTATWAQLADEIGYANWGGISLQYGKLAHRIAERLGVLEPPKGFWIYVLADWAMGRDPESGHARFVLRQPVIGALRRLGILPNDEDPPKPPRYWTCQWKNKYWRGDINSEYGPLCSSGSNNFRKRGVSPGDIAYVISVLNGQLYIGGKMTVRRIVSRSEAVRIWRNENLWDADEWVIDEEEMGTPFNPRRRLAPEVTKKLRLIVGGSERRGYAFVSNTHLDSQTTRGIRELTPESAAFLDRIISLTDSLPRSDRIVTVTEKLLRDCEQGKRVRFALPEEIVDDSHISEGSVQQILVNRYERDPRARARCIDHYGTKCDVCGFDFAAKYGEAMAGFIHVHHLKPLSAIGKGYRVHPVRDLRPVCPNCHAVAHRREPPYSLDEVRDFIHSQMVLLPRSIRVDAPQS
jgi:hypothetical protein